MSFALPFKRRIFTEGFAHAAELRHVSPGGRGDPCDANPAFCRPFSFAREAALWGR